MDAISSMVQAANAKVSAAKRVPMLRVDAFYKLQGRHASRKRKAGHHTTGADQSMAERGGNEWSVCVCHMHAITRFLPLPGAWLYIFDTDVPQWPTFHAIASGEKPAVVDPLASAELPSVAWTPPEQQVLGNSVWNIHQQHPVVVVCLQTCSAAFAGPL